MMTMQTLKMKAGCGADVLNTTLPPHSKDGLPFDLQGVYVHIDPADLPEYLQPLMEGVADDLTVHQRKELAAAIYEYQDFFSSGPVVDPQTWGVRGSSSAPLIWASRDLFICPPPPLHRLSITKQQIEQEEVKKMLDRGVIEPCQNSWASPNYEGRWDHRLLRGL